MKTLLIILQIFPLLLEVLRSVEKAIPEPGMGKEKLQLVEQTMTIAYDGVSEIWPTVQAIITKIVDVFNSTGVFKKAA